MKTKTCKECNQIKPVEKNYKATKKVNKAGEEKVYIGNICNACEYQRDKRNRREKREAMRGDLTYTARIPAKVFKPYFESLLREYGTKNRIHQATGVTVDVLRSLADGKIETISLDDCDKLLLDSIYNLNDVTEDCIEWAKKTGDDWPIGNKYSPGKVNA